MLLLCTGSSDTANFPGSAAFCRIFHSESWAILNPFLKKFYPDQKVSTTSSSLRVTMWFVFRAPADRFFEPVSPNANLLANTLISIQKSRRFFANLAYESVARAK
jgi:hypothetical protein